MKNSNLSNVCWHPAHSQYLHIPIQWHGWLLHQQSLIQLLKKTYNGEVSISVLSQSIKNPTKEERQYLNFTGQSVFVRAVIILCHQKPKIYARTIVPEDSLTKSNKCLTNLGNTAVSDYLFTQKKCKRQQLEITITSNKNIPIPYDKMTSSELIWGRRSLFLPDNKPVAVSEFFLSPLLYPCNNLQEQKNTSSPLAKTTHSTLS